MRHHERTVSGWANGVAAAGGLGGWLGGSLVVLAALLLSVSGVSIAGGNVASAGADGRAARSADRSADVRRGGGLAALGQRQVKTEAERFAAINTAEVVFVATLAEVQMGAMSRSIPPIYMMSLTFEKPEMLRGEAPESLTFRHTTLDPGAVRAGQRVVVGLRRSATTANQPATWRITEMHEADEATLALARRALAVPVGWRYADDGQPVSPWAEAVAEGTAQRFAWPRGAGVWREAPMRCAVTGRPALFVPEGVTLTVEPVIPEDAEKYVNPMGDGEFVVTVTNTSDGRRRVPALLFQPTPNDESGRILWAESLVVINGGRAQPMPGAERVSETVRWTELEPGQSVRVRVNLLGVPGVNWPRGGSRVSFTIGLGQLSANATFYYLSRHHDALRERLRGGDESSDG